MCIRDSDVAEETEGSRVIAQAILDDDPRTLWLLSWGGMNTIVRALMSIAERYRATPEWPAVQQRVYQKVRVMGVADGVGQDNSWLDHGRELFPELIFWCMPYMYGGYVDTKTAQPDTLPLFKAPWPELNLTQGNGPLMARYMLYGDGKVYEKDVYKRQALLRATREVVLPIGQLDAGKGTPARICQPEPGPPVEREAIFAVVHRELAKCHGISLLFSTRARSRIIG